MSVLATNRKATYTYEILDRWEAGIELRGYEVKSIKTGHISLAGSFATVKNNQIWLVNADIPPYQSANTPSDYDSTRSRRLLLSRAQIKTLLGRVKEKNLTIVPIKVYTVRDLIKIEIGLGRGKKMADKRDSIKKRDVERDIGRTLKN